MINDIISTIKNAMLGAGFTEAPEYFDNELISESIRDKHFSIFVSGIRKNQSQQLGKVLNVVLYGEVNIYGNFFNNEDITIAVDNAEKAIKTIETIDTPNANFEYLTTADTTLTKSPEQKGLIINVRFEANYYLEV